MKRVFAVLVLLALSLGLVGSMGAAAQNETANESVTKTTEIPPEVEAILEEIDPANAPETAVETVRTWASESTLDDLRREDRAKVRSWLADVARSERDRDRDDGSDHDEDELGNATEVDLSEADTLATNETIRFSDSARIIGWEFADRQVRIAIQTEITTTVTVSDALAGVEEDGAIHVPKTTHDLDEGVHIVSMPVVTVNDGASVGVTANGATVRLSSGMTQGENPLQYFGGESGLFAGMGISISMSGIAALFVIYREDKGVMKA